MPLYQAIILALVQAVTEFLPISSTAHLILVPWLLVRFGSWDAVLVVFGSLYVIGALFWLLLKPEGTIVEQALSRVQNPSHAPAFHH